MIEWLGSCSCKSDGLRFKPSTLLFSGFVFSCLGFNSFALFVYNQLVCLLPVGFLNTVFMCIYYVFSNLFELNISYFFLVNALGVVKCILRTVFFFNYKSKSFSDFQYRMSYRYNSFHNILLAGTHCPFSFFL